MNESFGTFADELRIETPEQVELRFPIAGLGSRFLALLTDTALQLVAYLLLGLLFYLTLSNSAVLRAVNGSGETAQKWMLAAFILVNFLAFWGYFALFEALWNGQTPGKRVLKIRVLKDSGRSITLFEALARNLLRVVDMIPPSLYLVGVISILATRENKRLGDLVAGTIVVHERTDEQPLLTHNSRSFTAGLYAAQGFGEAVAPPPLAGDAGLAADAVARLDAGDLHLVESFFARALDLDLGTRARLAAKIAAHVEAKTGLALPVGTDPERWLQTVAHRMRVYGRG